MAISRIHRDQLTGLWAAGWVLPPVVRRGEGTRSGAPSWMTAQTQAVQGCTVCVVPPDLLPEPRAPDRRRANKWGRRLLVTLGLSKVTRQAAQRRRNPVEGSALVSCMAKPCQKRRATPHPNPLPQGERKLLPWCNALRLLAPYLSPTRGEGTVTADDYAPLIDPTRLHH